MRRDSLIFERYKQIVREARKPEMLNGWRVKRGPLTFTGNVSSDGQSGEYMHPVEKYIKWFTKDGIQHRTDGPAYSTKTGNQAWYLNGQVHRDGDEPAVISDRGTMFSWYKHGKRHRDNGEPAEINTKTGYKGWFVNGLISRLDGPAIIHSDGTETYAIDGVKYPEKEFKEYTSMLNLIDKELNK